MNVKDTEGMVEALPQASVMRYETLTQVVGAYRSGALSRQDSKMYLDANDATVTVSLGGDEHEDVFTADPSDLIMQCLDLLGIPWEWS